MLLEADQMPVVMDEVQLLRCHVQALEWAAKVRPQLPSEFPTQLQNRSVCVAAAIQPTLKLVELQKFQKEINK